MKEMNESWQLESDYDFTSRREMEENLDKLVDEYEILNSFQCSSLTGENIKLIFDEAVQYMLKVKSAQHEQKKSESGVGVKQEPVKKLDVMK